MNQIYLNAVRLLLKVAPYVFDSEAFALKGGTAINLEINHVFRGSLRPATLSSLKPVVEDQFLLELELPLLASEELYGSKIVAALDRQHPRDLFDLLGLYDEGGLSDGVVECFVSYLAGHNRPIHEVLFARKADVSRAYVNEFRGMTREPIELNVLLEVRERLFAELPAALTLAHRSFLLGLAAAEPDWDLMACPHLGDMPALRWKLRNLENLRTTNRRKFEGQAEQLSSAFDRLDAL